MRRTTLWATLFFVLGMLHPSTATAGRTERTLEASIQRETATSLRLETAVGDVTVSPSTGKDLHVAVKLTPRKGGFFSSITKAERQVEAASLAVERHGTRISLEIEGFHGEPRFEARWVITVPSDLALKLNMGVGNLEVKGITGSIDVDVGVGDVTIEAAGGEIATDVGVGDVTVETPAASYGTIECSAGVGDVELEVNGTTRHGNGMISKELTWKGPGERSMDLETGVGSIAVTLSGTPAAEQTGNR